jgi:hypothetical protein
MPRIADRHCPPHSVQLPTFSFQLPTASFQLPARDELDSQHSFLIDVLHSPLSLDHFELDDAVIIAISIGFYDLFADYATSMNAFLDAIWSSQPRFAHFSMKLRGNLLLAHSSNSFSRIARRRCSFPGSGETRGGHPPVRFPAFLSQITPSSSQSCNHWRNSASEVRDFIRTLPRFFPNPLRRAQSNDCTYRQLTFDRWTPATVLLIVPRPALHGKHLRAIQVLGVRLAKDLISRESTETTVARSARSVVSQITRGTCSADF